MSCTAEQLYQLIPSIYRMRDAQRGEPLKALISLLAEQGALVEKDIGQLYQNWFIETCDEWVVPYIGDLLGIKPMFETGDSTPVSQRAFVGNTIAYRRRKGTARVIEQLAYDITGWRARTVEFFDFLATTQYVNHPRLHRPFAPDLREAARLENVHSPFDHTAHTADIRSISRQRGIYNLSQCGIFLCRIPAYKIIRASVREAGTPSCFYIHPAGMDTSLFHSPYTEDDITRITAQEHLPLPLNRRVLYDELEARRKALADSRAPSYTYFDDRPQSRSRPAIEIYLNDSNSPVPAEQICIANLSGWETPPDTKSYLKTELDGSLTPVDLALRVAVDPVLGRITLAPSVADASIRCSYSYGFSGDIGAGPFSRYEHLEPFLDRPVTWQIGVSKTHTVVTNQVVSTLHEAITLWNDQPQGSVGIITIMDNSAYDESLSGDHRIVIPEANRLMIVAAEWPQREIEGGLPGELHRINGEISPDQLRPFIRGNIEIEGTAGTDDIPGQLILDGFLVDGAIDVIDGNLGLLHLSHCTFLPGSGSLTIAPSNSALLSVIYRSLCPPIETSGYVSFSCSESVIDGSDHSINAPQSHVVIDACTVFGTTEAMTLSADNSLFIDRITTHRRQEGCIRYCYVEEGSLTPRRYHCQPDTSLESGTPGDEAMIRARLRPSFTSRQYGMPGYAQLGRTCAQEITTGADDGSEMGAFCFLKQPQRLKNLQSNLSTYTPFGMEIGLFFVS